MCNAEYLTDVMCDYEDKIQASLDSMYVAQFDNHRLYEQLAAARADLVTLQSKWSNGTSEIDETSGKNGRSSEVEETLEKANRAYKMMDAQYEAGEDYCTGEVVESFMEKDRSEVQGREKVVGCIRIFEADEYEASEVSEIGEVNCNKVVQMDGYGVSEELGTDEVVECIKVGESAENGFSGIDEMGKRDECESSEHLGICQPECLDINASMKQSPRAIKFLHELEERAEKDTTDMQKKTEPAGQFSIELLQQMVIKQY